MKLTLSLLSAVSAIFLSGGANAATILYSFTAVTGAPTSGTPLNFTISDFSKGNSLGTVATPVTTTSGSNTYAGASGGGNIGNAVAIGALNTGTSAYYEVTIDPDAGYTLGLTDIDFGTRSTGTGPQAYAIRSSIDSYAADIVTGTIGNNSTWALKDNTFTAVNSTVDGEAVTLRIYTYGGAGSPSNGTINNKLDDISITVSAVAVVPEPTSAVVLGALGLLGILRRRR